jgi:hypothetical protein
MNGEDQILTFFTPQLSTADVSTFMDRVEEEVKKVLLKSFTDEGHTLTGALIRDIESEASAYSGGFAIDFMAAKYGVYLNFGVKAAKIPYTRGSGAGRSAYITGLMKYVHLRMGISDPRQQKSVAFAIATAQKKKGMPLRTLGQGTKWADKASDELSLEPIFADLAETYVSKSLTTMAKEFNDGNHNKQ